jgi:peptidyl-Asp metalloendopeptidase
VSVLIIDKDPNLCGLSNLGPNVSTAFAVVPYHCATDNYSFAHELGHLLGALHDKNHAKSEPGIPSYARGYQHLSENKGEQFRTIMAYRCNTVPGIAPCPMIPYWSNPKVDYNKFPTGTVDADNARWLNDNGQLYPIFRMPIGYSFCANENETCRFKGKQNVAYGANGEYVYKRLTAALTVTTPLLVTRSPR